MAYTKSKKTEYEAIRKFLQSHNKFIYNTSFNVICEEIIEFQDGAFILNLN